jgi:YGGT family.
MDRILSGLPLIIGGAFQLYELIIFVYCILSFVPSLYGSRFGQVIVRLVQPLLNAISRVIPTRFGMFDFSPIIAFILIGLVQKVIFMII